MKLAVLALILSAQVAMPPCNHPDGHCPEPLSKQERADIKSLEKKPRVCRVPLVNHLLRRCLGRYGHGRFAVEPYQGHCIHIVRHRPEDPPPKGYHQAVLFQSEAAFVLVAATTGTHLVQMVFRPTPRHWCQVVNRPPVGRVCSMGLLAVIN